MCNALNSVVARQDDDSLLDDQDEYQYCFSEDELAEMYGDFNENW